MKLAINRIRFELLRLFRPSYIDRSIELRRGECKRCGVCCKDCKHLLYNGCLDYTERFNINVLCRTFPIDDKDKNRVNKKCGYYW